MADLDRISELLLSGDSELPDWYHERFPPLADTEPTLDPNSLEALIANQQDQDDFLMTMAMVLGPGKFLGPGKGAANLLIPPLTQTGRKVTQNLTPGARNVGRQRFMLPANEIKRAREDFIPPLTDVGRKITGSSNIPRTAAREDFIPPLTDIGRKVSGRGPSYPSPSPVAEPLYKGLGIPDKAMDILGGATAGVGAYATAGIIYDNLDEETKAHLRELLKIPTK